MPKPNALFTPPSSYSPHKHIARLDLALGSPDDDVLDIDFFGMTAPTSPPSYVKEEAEDMAFPSHRFVGQTAFDVNHPFHTHQFGSPHDNINAINPSDLSMNSGNALNTQFASASYMQGAAGIADDELADSLATFEHQQHQQHQQQQQQHQHQQQQPFSAFTHHDNLNQQEFFSAPANHANINSLYSNTPDDLPMHSPFAHPSNFDFNHYQSPAQPRAAFPASMPTGVMRQRVTINRTASDSRPPMSPKTPAMAGLHLGTPDSGHFASQPIMTNMHRHQKNVSGQWEGTPGSQQSWIDSPTASPHPSGLHHHHQQISQVLHSGKHNSLPNKVDMGQAQDAKKRRRRESHNLVERRRRDNINERILDLSRLVPQHRLEDEKIRKHINNNGPMSPTMASSGMSPPQATSLLAGGMGRRAAGNITQGLPIEEKDKGPNKGDILNGAVSWTRDLMWMLYKKIQECDEMAAQLQQATGEHWPVEPTEEERRMKTEIMDALHKNGTASFRYSRGPGSGLRVPKHTNLAGDSLTGLSPQSLSPGMQSTGSGSASNPPHYWNDHSLKEEDEYGMEMS